MNMNVINTGSRVSLIFIGFDCCRKTGTVRHVFRAGRKEFYKINWDGDSIRDSRTVDLFRGISRGFSRGFCQKGKNTTANTPKVVQNGPPCLRM